MLYLTSQELQTFSAIEDGLFAIDFYKARSSAVMQHITNCWFLGQTCVAVRTLAAVGYEIGTTKFRTRLASDTTSPPLSRGGHDPIGSNRMQ